MMHLVPKELIIQLLVIRASGKPAASSNDSDRYCILPIQLIILRSMSLFTQSSMMFVDVPYRVLIANICNLGAYPCPRHTIPKDCMHHIGMERDILQC